MQASVLYAAHDLRYQDYPDPVLTEDDELVVDMLRGGICGSDMHYYEEGGIGETIRVVDPIVLGHEGIGRVREVGRAVTHVQPGDTVAIRPARPCFACRFCGERLYTYCENMRHLGSASTRPHTDGLFSDRVLLHRSQAFPVTKVDVRVGAFAEPTGVAFNGVRRLGELYGKHLLVMGAGPIGCLCIAAARLLGAETITAVDVRSEPLAVARRMGADVVCNSREDPDRIEGWKEHKGAFDCLLDASGNGHAVTSGMAMTRPEGVVSQVGMFGATLPTQLGSFVTKGLHWNGVQRFYDEFTAAVRALEEGWIDPLPLLSAEYPVAECDAALKKALAPETSKVQVIIGE
ncbi:MAG: L-idonate 5-dehydrogenase [Planctomycetes bacterium]|nr:L-idonate 5-dehydrogenase [Planctomycetota bacterium]